MHVLYLHVCGLCVIFQLKEQDGKNILSGLQTCGNTICDLIYRNRSKSHIGSYEIIDFKDFNTL